MMRKILIINGPNLNLLGIREPDIYGTETYKDMRMAIMDYAETKNVKVTVMQSNHEGEIVDLIQRAREIYQYIIINPAAYTHTSIAIADAIKAVNIPTIEVHLSDPDEREDFRKQNFIRPCCVRTFKGNGLRSYLDAIDYCFNDIFNK